MYVPKVAICGQGYQIGRIFVHWEKVYFGQFFDYFLITEVAQIFVVFMNVVISGVNFSQTRLATPCLCH
jgi:hypothetical protein